MRKLGLLAGLLMSAAPVLAEVPVRSVTLFEAGLAEITRETRPVLTVSDEVMFESYDPVIELTVPRGQLDDVLKSLTLRGEVGTARIRLDAPSALEDAFDRVPVGPDGAGDLPTLLNGLRGVRVSVGGGVGTSPVSGRVLGVARTPCVGDLPCPVTLQLLDGEALVSVPLDPSLRVRVDDPDMRDRLGDAVDALAQNTAGSDRELRVETDAGGPVQLTYVVPAPVWRTAYRAVPGAGGLRLQAWAVVENASGADWEEVRLTLSSGSPRTLRADLSRRDWGERETYEEAPSLKRGVEMSFNALEAPAADRSLGLSELSSEAEMTDRGLDSRFTFPDPLDLEAGELISLPFLTEEVPVTRSLVWRGRGADRSGNPEMVLRVENPLPIRLPAGIMTVSDETGYLGDAAFPVLVPGDAADVPFGADQRVTLRETVTEVVSERSVSLSGGALRVRERRLRTTTYEVSAPEGAPEVTVLHPVRSGWALTGRAGTTPEEAGAYRLRLAAGAAELTVTEERPVSETWLIGDLSRDRLVSLSAEELSDADRARLNRVLLTYEELDRVREEVGTVRAARARLTEDQERARRMMGSAPANSDMERRFAAAVLEREDRIAEADQELSELNRALNRLEAILQGLIGEAR